MQIAFNPVDYCFEWTKDWYQWDSKAAHKAACKARNDRALELRHQNKTVCLSTIPNQLITRGGIGSGRPQIEAHVTIYMVTVMN